MSLKFSLHRGFQHCWHALLGWRKGDFKLKPGKRLRLVAEPHNPADPNAVAIYRKDVKLGYIPRDQNDLAAQLLHFGHDDVLECRILKVDKRLKPGTRFASGFT